jgi:hypothetical protein
MQVSVLHTTLYCHGSNDEKRRSLGGKDCLVSGGMANYQNYSITSPGWVITPYLVDAKSRKKIKDRNSYKPRKLLPEK